MGIIRPQLPTEIDAINSRNMKLRHMILLAGMVLSLLPLTAKDFLATDFGAAGNNQKLNTNAIQTAIDHIARKGGGRLVFTPGTYLTGSIQLKSNVEIHLQRGAVIKGSPNSRDYSPINDTPSGSTKRNDDSRLALILARQATGIALTGEGTIDGNGLLVALDADSLHHAGIRVDPNYNTRRKRPSELVRPKLFYFQECSNVLISSLRLTNSACWGLSFDQCRDMRLEHLTIRNRAYWNNDGIDLTDCRRVRVTQCDVDAADDAICLKSSHPESCNDSIEIDNCSVRSSASAVKFGTASYGGFRNIRISNIRVRDTFRSAIALECVDGGILENIDVSDIEAHNTGNAIFIRLGARDGKRPGVLRHVSIRRLYCEVPFGRPDINYDLRGPEVDFFHNPFPSSITGLTDNKVSDILLQDIEIVCPGRATKGMAYMPLSRLKDVPEQAGAYPEFSMFGELPAWGLYVRHADGIRLDNVRLRLKDSDFRPAVVLDDVTRFQQHDVMAPGGIFRHHSE